ncbi:hypothetical protein D3C85_1388380 [compost metagenome]
MVTPMANWAKNDSRLAPRMVTGLKRSTMRFFQPSRRSEAMRSNTRRWPSLSATFAGILPFHACQISCAPIWSSRFTPASDHASMGDPRVNPKGGGDVMGESRFYATGRDVATGHPLTRPRGAV